MKFAPCAPNGPRNSQEEQQVGQRARDADRGEAHQLPGEADRHPGHAGLERRRGPAARAAPRRGTAPRANARSSRATPRRSPSAVRDDVHAGVGVVHPVHRHLVDAQPGALGEDEQLGVEEPAGVLDERQQPLGARRRGSP